MSEMVLMYVGGNAIPTTIPAAKARKMVKHGEAEVYTKSPFAIKTKQPFLKESKMVKGRKKETEIGTIQNGETQISVTQEMVNEENGVENQAEYEDPDKTVAAEHFETPSEKKIEQPTIITEDKPTKPEKTKSQLTKEDFVNQMKVEAEKDTLAGRNSIREQFAKKMYEKVKAHEDNPNDIYLSNRFSHQALIIADIYQELGNDMTALVLPPAGIVNVTALGITQDQMLNSRCLRNFIASGYIIVGKMEPKELIGPNYWKDNRSIGIEVERLPKLDRNILQFEVNKDNFYGQKLLEREELEAELNNQVGLPEDPTEDLKSRFGKDKK